RSLQDTKTATNNTLADILCKYDIRVAGTAEEPLFCACDLGAYINDAHWAEALPALSASDVQWVDTRDPQGHARQRRFLTTRGACRYLLHSRGPLARSLYLRLFKTLVTARGSPVAVPVASVV